MRRPEMGMGIPMVTPNAQQMFYSTPPPGAGSPPHMMMPHHGGAYPPYAPRNGAGGHYPPQQGAKIRMSVASSEEHQVNLPGQVVQPQGPPPNPQASEGRRIDAGTSKTKAKAGANVLASFGDPCSKPLLDPHFIFPDPVGRPNMRPWVPIFTTPWWKFDNPIDNTLVRGTSFVVFLCALFLFIFGVSLCEECKQGIEHACELCVRDPNGPFETPYIWYMQLVIWYDFFIRTVFGMSPLSPFAVIANITLKALDFPLDMVPSSAKRFSFFLGIILNLVLFLLHFVFDNNFRRGPALALIIFSGLESIGGFCVGCWFFKTFFQLRDRWELRMDYRKIAKKEGNPARPVLAEHRGIGANIWPLPVYDKTTASHDKGYDYDLVVIGGGSGGLSASKEAARFGAKVAVLDFVKPTAYGSRWGLGGTCVNVGCIPKKLYHTAAIYGHYLHEAGFFGWEKSGQPETGTGHAISWQSLKDNIQEHIRSLNNGYITGLRSAKVEYINARGSFVDAHTIQLDAQCPTVKCPGPKCTRITARRVIVAVGGRPQYPDIPGARDYAITSDDIFSLEKPPGKTLVVGASYIALECAGFLTGLGFDVSVMVRSMVLRGFDRDCADRIKENMVDTGTRFIEKSIPVRIEASGDGKRKVTFKHVDTGVESVETFETVMFAIGREPVTKELNLEAAGVKVANDGKIWTWNERTTAPSVYALGDVAHGVPELTPVAIKQGLMLAKRIYGNSNHVVNLDHVPTTVFTPLEYGSIGFSEERAIETFGDEAIEVYHSEFTPLEYALPHKITPCYAKIIVNYLDHQRVIGFHYLGPNAGEVTQGFASAFIAGLNLDEWNLIVGIHPTTAEEMVSLRRTKRSGMDPKKTGC